MNIIMVIFLHSHAIIKERATNVCTNQHLSTTSELKQVWSHRAFNQVFGIRETFIFLYVAWLVNEVT